VELTSGAHVLGVEFVKESTDERHTTHGTAKLYVDADLVAQAELRTQPSHFALCGEGLTIGRDGGDPVSKEYDAGFAFTGGRILEVEVNIGGDVYLDVERDFAAALARD
jgi:arylsulfatase